MTSRGRSIGFRDQIRQANAEQLGKLTKTMNPRLVFPALPLGNGRLSNPKLGGHIRLSQVLSFPGFADEFADRHELYITQTYPRVHW